MYSSPNSPDSTESGGSTMNGHSSPSKPSKVRKSHSSTTTSAASRGPPGSCKFFISSSSSNHVGLIEFDSQRTMDSCRSIDGRRRDFSGVRSREPIFKPFVSYRAASTQTSILTALWPSFV
jgi:hypothetical protein